MASWLKRRRRRKLVAAPFPDAWRATLNRNVKLYAQLNEVERTKLQDDLRILVAEKYWEGCNGMPIDDEVKVTIAGQAALLLLGFEQEYFDGLQTVLVYPEAYVAPDRKVIGGGVIVEGRVGREGEAWSRGPVVLSWPGVLQGGRREVGTGNLVLHEFAHQLDMHNGDIVDGTPPLGSRAEYNRWQQVTQREYRRLVHDCERGAATLLDCYGTADIGEFFAVATECFFQQPREMQLRHAELYEILSGFYRQDPAARCARLPDRSP